ncbi:MAG: hypothetical protein ACRELY_05135 [Polyangiaceae bacterium]
MFDEDAERPSSKLRGRLSEVYFPALLGESQEELTIRLGERASIYDPVFGAAAGVAEIKKKLTELAKWLSDSGASYAHERTFVGVDRDVAEGILSLRVDGRHVDLPVAVVVERRREREVDLRVYHATQPIDRWQAARPPRANPETEPSLAQDVASHLSAVRLGDADAIVAGFESIGALRDGVGRTHARDAGQLHDFYVSLLQNAHGANDWVPIVRRSADDGRTCSIEYEIEKLRGGETAPKEGLMVFERGDSALFCSVRIYDESL